MMNFLALGLVLTSLVTAGFFTPTPQNPKSRDDDNVIVRDGHRVVVVEYEKDDGNTKVLISPPEKSEFLATANDKLNEKMEGARDELGNLVENQEDRKFSPRELICDAYGKCKHKIASAFEKTRESAAETEEAAKDKIQESKEKVKDEVVEKARRVKDTIQEYKEKVKDEVAEKARKELREILRHAWEVAGDVLDYVAPRERLGAAAGVLHLMGFAAAYGMGVWITFASSYVLAGALPRHQFAVVQSKIYPVYFRGMACGVGMALLGHLVGRRDPAPVFQGLNLAAALGMILVNLRWLEPQATKVMVERMKKEKEEGTGQAVETCRKAGESTAETAGRVPASEAAAARSQIIQLSQTLERLNSYSSFLNALTLVSLTWHLVHLGQRLHAATC
ncbi:hypothetical protein SASPL_103549 [Salvia splendens]|uniref:TMEM205-like domain-containing protein n=1 Tax=Salvia splendens TaxID=180675 RepID=A0A8X8YJW2_SALSN|nr:uncharacterized protein LOC121782069 [Salvia splendens]KAG6431977.1 hypothetical protein SASPL_103549 [Salvia splendens]